MLFKLSLKNIKKSIKDYGIYFFTLVFAVAMFYIFNSIDAQSSMVSLTQAKNNIVNSIVEIIGYVSVFVSVILGFLIIYSNKFLIKKRKKEIGLYLTLGMSKRKTSLILVIETVFVGIISLVIGLIAGIVLSQFLSIFIAKLFEVDLTNYHFIFSSTAFTKTLIYFGIIFLIVVALNVISLSRYKLIDLLNASKKNEQVKIRNKYITIISFIISVSLLAYAYYLLFDNALLNMDENAIIMIVSGALGTFLLFFSASGFLLKITQSIKKIYYKDLNMFTLKQVNSKINTTVISTTIISLMLLLTIGILSGSMSLANAFNTDFKENNLTDFTLNTWSYYGVVNEDAEIEIEDDNDFSDFENLRGNKSLERFTRDYVIFHKYKSDNITPNNMLTQKSKDILEKEYGSKLSLNFNVPIIKESEYIEYTKLISEEAIDIKDNEYMLFSNIDFIMDAYKEYYENKEGINISGTKLIPATDKIEKLAFFNFNTAGNDGVIVVSDKLVDDLELTAMSLVGNLINDSDIESTEEALYNYIFNEASLESGFELRTRTDMEATSLGMKVMLIYIGLYLGITFAISSATILAIGQLSESSDNKSRYKVLKQLGADNKMINKALLTQIAIVFMFPLLVALIHSYFGLRELNSIIIAIGNIDLTSNIILTTLFMILIYGGYFIITYLSSKNIIKE